MESRRYRPVKALAKAARVIRVLLAGATQGRDMKSQ